MSMALWVFSDKKLKSFGEWQSAIDAEDYPLKLDDKTPFNSIQGFLPAQLHGQLTGFECYHDDPRKLIRDNSDVNFGHNWKYVLGFRWTGSKVSEQRAAWMAGVAYARATEGIIFDDQEGKFRSAVEAREVVRDVERDVPEIDKKALTDKILRELKLGPYRE